MAELTTATPHVNLFCSEELCTAQVPDDTMMADNNHHNCLLWKVLINNDDVLNGSFDTVDSSIGVINYNPDPRYNYGRLFIRPQFPLEDELSEIRFLKDREQENLISDNSRLFFDTCSMPQESIHWMLNVCQHFRFDQSTAFLSVSYFNRFLHLQCRTDDGPPQKDFNAWFLQLLAVACVSIAAKLEEVEVPLLLNLQVAGAAYVFEPRIIQRMELLVLSTLDWRVNLVTPFCYIDYLIKKLDYCDTQSRAIFKSAPPAPNNNHNNHHSNYEALLRCVKDRILATCRDYGFLKYRASVIAVASIIDCCGCVLCGSLLQFCVRKGASEKDQEEGRLVLLSESEGLMQCVELMQSLPTTQSPTQIDTIDSTKSPFNKEESLLDSMDSIKNRFTKQSADGSIANESPMGVLDHADASSCASCESNLGHYNTYMRRRVNECCGCGEETDGNGGGAKHDGISIRSTSCVPPLVTSSSSMVSITKRKIHFESVVEHKARGPGSDCSLITSGLVDSEQRSVAPPLIHLPLPPVPLNLGPGPREDCARGMATTSTSTSTRKRKVNESYMPPITRSDSRLCL